MREKLVIRDKKKGEKQMEQKKSGVKNFLCSGAGTISMIILFYALIFGLFTMLITLFENSTVVVLIFVVVFAYFGWKALNKINLNVILIMPVGKWVVYYAVKGILSLVIGVFVAPFVLAKKIANEIQATAKDMEN